MKEEKHISLKEASKISGYAPDYIGQLIRKGKLKGKQVYSGVAWVTTEDALNTYLRDAQGSNKSRTSIALAYLDTLRRDIFAERFLHALLYVAGVFSVIIILVLFYLLSIKIERWLDERGQHQIESLRTI